MDCQILLLYTQWSGSKWCNNDIPSRSHTKIEVVFLTTTNRTPAPDQTRKATGGGIQLIRLGLFRHPRYFSSSRFASSGGQMSLLCSQQILRERAHALYSYLAHFRGLLVDIIGTPRILLDFRAAVVRAEGRPLEFAMSIYLDRCCARAQAT